MSDVRWSNRRVEELLLEVELLNSKLKHNWTELIKSYKNKRSN